MANLLNKVLNFVGWETEEDEMMESHEEKRDAYQHSPFLQYGSKKSSNKVVNIHSSSKSKVIVIQPENFDDAQEICDHLKNKEPIVINLELLEKDNGQRVIDFLSGSVYALDGSIQKVATGIFIVAPNNIDIAGDLKDELKSKGVFPWIK